MKKILFLLMVVIVVGNAQNNVKTPDTKNFQASYTAAGTDTITQANMKYFVGLVFNTVVASESVYVKQGADTLAKIVFTASPPVLPFTVTYNCRVDSVFSIIRKKASDITVIYRKDY
jgi:hypothetical protein